MKGAQVRVKAFWQRVAFSTRFLVAEIRYTVMEEPGRRCIGANALEKARRLQKDATDLDNLMSRLNQAHIGGGHLQRDGEVIHASYDRCYCGSASKFRELLSPTYCHCSCGWYRQLFESLLNRPVEVELSASILQGNECCQFLSRIQEPNWSVQKCGIRIS